MKGTKIKVRLSDQSFVDRKNISNMGVGTNMVLLFHVTFSLNRSKELIDTWTTLHSQCKYIFSYFC